jgi:hypothetical protein
MDSGIIYDDILGLDHLLWFLTRQVTMLLRFPGIGACFNLASTYDDIPLSQKGDAVKRDRRFW